MRKPRVALCACALVALPFLVSCAAHLDARTDDEVPPRFAHLLAEADRRVGQFVVVGGVLEGVRATEAGSELVLLHKPIDGWDRPRLERFGDGRILAAYGAALDPRLFAPGRAVTVVGEIAGVVEREEDGATRRYLAVRASEVRAWSRRELMASPFSRRETWYPPWYDPAVGTRPWWW